MDNSETQLFVIVIFWDPCSCCFFLRGKCLILYRLYIYARTYKCLYVYDKNFVNIVDVRSVFNLEWGFVM